MCIQGHSSRVTGALHMCVHECVLVLYCSFGWGRVIQDMFQNGNFPCNYKSIMFYTSPLYLGPIKDSSKAACNILNCYIYFS